MSSTAPVVVSTKIVSTEEAISDRPIKNIYSIDNNNSEEESRVEQSDKEDEHYEANNDEINNASFQYDTLAVPPPPPPPITTALEIVSNKEVISTTTAQKIVSNKEVISNEIVHADLYGDHLAIANAELVVSNKDASTNLNGVADDAAADDDVTADDDDIVDDLESPPNTRICLEI